MAYFLHIVTDFKALNICIVIILFAFEQLIIILLQESLEIELSLPLFVYDSRRSKLDSDDEGIGLLRR